MSIALPTPESCPWRGFDAAEFHVIIADDQEHLREIIARVLKKDGYSITLAEDGEKLLAEARERPPDLIVLDLMMPHLDGLSALRVIRDDPRLSRAYVLVLSGKSSIEEKLEAFECGTDDYLTKPYSVDELRARVRSGIRLRAVERHLERSQQQLIRQEKLATIGALASGIAHEFNNIMSGIAGYAQLAQRHEKYRDRLAEIALEQSRRAEKITSSLSTFASTASPRAEPTSVGALVEAAATLLKKAYSQRNLDLATEIEDGIPVIDINRGQFQQVILHLLINAKQAASPGGRVSVRLRREGTRLVFEVDDDGPGIPEQDRLKIFDPFYTTKGSRSDLGDQEGDGTGLGLTFSLNVVEAHQGALEVVPSRLGGACFRVTLPMEGVAQESPEAEESPAAMAPNSPRHLVMVEDDLTLQEVIEELLRGVDLECFTSGPEALEYCRGTSVDAVLLDINLVGPWDGWKVLEELGSLEVPPPVILTTGSIDVDTDSCDYPHLQLLRKPFRLGELEEALRVAIGSPSV